MNISSSNNRIDFKFADPAMNQFAAFVVEKFTNLDKKVDSLGQEVNNMGILVENLKNKTDQIINVVNLHTKKLESHTEMIGQLLVNVQELKDVAHAHNGMIHELKDDSKDVKRGLVQINRKLDQKVDVKDLKRLENRVLVLESI